MPTIVHITDLHLDGWPDNLASALEQVRGVGADLILIGGDNGGRLGIERTVAALKQEHPAADVAWVMGNHELWGKPYTVLWESFPRLDAVYLENANLHRVDCTVVGTYGHYDYTGGDPQVPFEDYENYRHGPFGWGDFRIHRLGRTNPEIAREIADRFRIRYEEAVARGLPIVVVTHTLAFDTLNAFPRNFYGAYGTNAEIGRILLESGQRPAVLFCGHTHNSIRRDDHGFAMINTGSDYDTVRTTAWELAGRAREQP